MRERLGNASEFERLYTEEHKDYDLDDFIRDYRISETKGKALMKHIRPSVRITRALYHEVKGADWFRSRREEFYKKSQVFLHMVKHEELRVYAQDARAMEMFGAEDMELGEKNRVRPLDVILLSGYFLHGLSESRSIREMVMSDPATRVEDAQDAAKMNSRMTAFRRKLKREPNLIRFSVGGSETYWIVDREQLEYLDRFIQYGREIEQSEGMARNDAKLSRIGAGIVLQKRSNSNM